MMTAKIKTKTAYILPKSVTSGWICFIGLISFMISIYLIRINNIDIFLGGVLSGLALIVPIVLLEYIYLKTYKRSSTGLNFKLKNTTNIERVSIKLIGLYFTLALIAFIYWLIPEYRSDMYLPYWTLAKFLLKVIAFGSIPYFFLLDRYLIEPEETYWKVGMIVMGRWKMINRDGLKDYFLGWLVKAFFLPLMFTSLCNNIGIIKNIPLYIVMQQNDFPTYFNYLYNYIFTIDLVFVTVGYVMTLRIFDSHIRTVEPSFLGWIVALQCYQPFWGVLSGKYFAYESGHYWWFWFTDYHHLYIIWGSLILILLSIYSWASMYFGIRFSNLTNRGIITKGPYRFMRHPAYVSKNLSWWLFSMPFISQEGFSVGLKHSLMLLMVNILYFLRAKTEERHLSKDPIYVQYATVINETGIFRKLFKLVPYLKYKPLGNI
jgi:isoprenylcysteine carboxyl methyltransferase (ICMT) family protein YpbQ